MTSRFCQWFLAALLLTAGQAAWADTVVFAAASLTNVLDEIASDYAEQSGKKVIVSYAGSSVLAKQIEAGSPAQIFISADMDWMRYLQKRDFVKGDPYLLAGNKLVMIAPSNSKLRLTIGKGMNLGSVLGGDKLALADPTSVPAGKYARAALEYFDEWSSIEDKILPFDNVRIALTIVEQEEAPLGVVYATDAKVSKGVKVVGVFPDESHEPIVYPAALVKENSNADADAFFAYLQSKAAANVLTKFGFVVSL